MTGQRYKQQTFTIFAITATTMDGDDELVFVSKTTQRDLKAVLRYHRKHNYYASPLFEEGTDVQIHPLKTVLGSAPEVYRYILAYMRYFIEHDYDVISHYKPYEACLDLRGEAQELYGLISEKSVADILQCSDMLYDSATPTEKIQKTKTPLDARLSIRLTQREYQCYCSWCKMHQVTQRDALLMLLAQNSSTPALSAQRIKDQSHFIECQKHHIRQLNSLLRKGSRGANADQKLIDALHLCKNGVYRYMNHVLGNGELPPPPLPCLSWTRFVNICPNWHDYHSRSCDGFFLCQLHYLCYSSGPNSCIFLFGHDLDTNENVRLRFYDKREYVGPHPTRSSHFYEGVCLLINTKQDAHGASDIYFALPLPQKVEALPKTVCSGSSTSLSDILLDATQRSIKANNPY